MASVGRHQVRGQRFSPGQVDEWVRASCQRQGVPVVVSDPDVVSRVVVLLTGREVQRAR